MNEHVFVAGAIMCYLIQSVVRFTPFSLRSLVPWGAVGLVGGLGSLPRERFL